MRQQPFTVWAHPLPTWERGEIFQSESGRCAVRGVTVLYRITRSIIGGINTLMVPFAAVPGSYSPARRAD